MEPTRETVSMAEEERRRVVEPHICSTCGEQVGACFYGWMDKVWCQRCYGSTPDAIPRGNASNYMHWPERLTEP